MQKADKPFCDSTPSFIAEMCECRKGKAAECAGLNPEQK